MRRIFLAAPIVYAMLLLLISCQKEIRSNNKLIEDSNGNLVLRVNSWLQNERNGRSPAKADNIDLLKANLNYAAARTEQFDNNIGFVIIPINEELIYKKNLNKNSTLTLLLIIDKFGKISSGSIIYFQPSDGEKHILPSNTFTNLFRRKASSIDGVYKILTVTGRWLSQIETKNGRLFSSGVVQKKDKQSSQKTNESSQRTNTCTDWYLVTTYYFSDGSTATTSEYLGTTCGGCDDPNYQSFCPNDGGGGGTGPDDIENGGDDLSATISQPAPDPNSGSSDPGDPLIPVTWHAWVAWSYNHTQNRFDYIDPGTPYPIPVSQPFTDRNGNPAIMVVSLGPWSVEQIPLTIKHVLVQYTLISVHTYNFTTGTRVLTFDEGLSKVVGPL